MPYDADELRSLIESRIAEHGVDAQALGSQLANEVGARVQELAGQILDTVVQKAIEVKAEEVLAAATETPSGGDPREAFGKLRRAIEAIEVGKTQVDILKALLLGASDFCARVALFIVKGDKGIGWLAQGFGTTPPFTDEGIKKVSVPLSADTFFRNVFNACVTFHGPGDGTGDNGKFYERIGAFVPFEALAVPLVIKGKVVAILYGDGGSEVGEIGGHDAAAALVQVAAMSIKLIPLKMRPEESGESGSRFTAPTESGTYQRQAAAAPPAPAPPPARQPAPHAAPAATPSPAAPGRTGAMPAAASAAMAGLPPEERKVHEEAKRFARLLVSEIKLYNEAKVAVGKRNKDLYERLKEDIERSRQMYNERYPAKVTSTTNYFFEELVAQLADGDRSALGI